MGTIHRTAMIDVTPEVAWDFLDRYTRSEVHVFSNCVAERQEGEYRVVTLPDGQEIWERNVTVDRARRRAVYAISGLLGAEHHQAEMRVDVADDGSARLVWITDLLPDAFAEQLAPVYDQLFDELTAAVNAHRLQPAP
jgi:Polyketide cyclase / dehydrase and lipid transport